MNRRVLMGSVIGVGLTVAKKASGSAAEDGGDFDLISDGIITVGADATYPPHTFLDPKTNEVVGFDVDLSNLIASRLGLIAEFVTIEWSGIIPALQAKRFDLITCEMNITPGRAEVLDFSDPVLVSGHVVIVRSETMDIRSTADLKDRTVLVPLGTTEEVEARKHTEKVKTYPTLATCFRELSQGRGDAIIVDLVVASYYAGVEGSSFKVVTPLLNETKSAYAFRKDESSAILLDAFNTHLEEMRLDGTLERLTTKWILPLPNEILPDATPTD